MLINFNDKLSKPVSVALGYFDCVHKGHRKIFETAKSFEADFAVFTIKENAFKLSDVYGFNEKCELFSDCGAKYIIYADGNKDFFDLSPVEFLEKFTANFNVKAFVCGEDFTFGKNAFGNAEVLKRFCNNKGIEFTIVKTEKFGDEKISSRRIKNLLALGEVKTANELLCSPYFIKGKVVYGRGEGTEKVVATANVILNKNNTTLKRGVYATKTVVGEKEYFSVTNYGNCPTFACDKETVETHLIDFQGSLYGEEIKVIFLDYLREIKTFTDASELKKQILKDMEYFQ